jgi:hypothetical protein
MKGSSLYFNPHTKKETAQFQWSPVIVPLFYISDLALQASNFEVTRLLFCLLASFILSLSIKPISSVQTIGTPYSTL